ncbi:hypothetical protein P171DRAFT_92817 [Karstenula rhodostoma CBS 690.94]|uniref:Ubiquitin-like-conjugating enzyme ATG10 n=1 Tax=Karstenula rhodostoma CBS 690.94 TaxID=1392251 RepID=A0A9P4U8T7_9PLEO|nr:hypothetical protein P171DRAFT_92817 [Karstenula rhodostoma CBS 690.94]
MKPVASPPHLSAAEFHTACTTLVNSFNALQDAPSKAKWLDISLDPGENMLRIAKELSVTTTSHQEPNSHDGPEIEDDDDDERLHSTANNTPLIHYDVLLSSSYTVPVLYFYISDALHRYPPTMDTLYMHIIAPEYVDQTKDVGVLGGITITDHPIFNRPVFFIHPCRTAEVIQASLGGRDISSFEYLLMWIGAMGKSVALDVQVDLVLNAREMLQGPDETIEPFAKV